MPKKYAAKVYLGTFQTMGKQWVSDENLTIKNWPNSYQAGSQKGEAKIVYKDLSSITNYYYDQKTYQSRNYNMPFNHITFPYI